MAYNYPPQYLTGLQSSMQNANPYGYQPLQNNITCAYVQGENAAKSYPLAPGQFAVLIDTEEPVIYTKTTDQYGRPLPMKILDYVERGANPKPELKDQYITRDEFEKFKEEYYRPKNPRNDYKKSNREEQ